MQLVTVGEEEGRDGGKGLMVEYTVPASTILAVGHQIKPALLADATAILFRVKTSGQATLLISLEENSGGEGEGEEGNKANYSTTVQVEATDEWRTVVVSFDSLKLGDDNFDPNGQLDPELVGMLMIGDATAAMAQADIENTLCLDTLLAVK